LREYLLTLDQSLLSFSFYSLRKIEMLNINTIHRIEEIIEAGIIKSHNIDPENLTSLTKLKIVRRMNQMIRLCLYIELYRRKHATNFEPLLERKALHHAMHTLFSIEPMKAQLYQLKDIVILFHNEIKGLSLTGDANNFIEKLDKQVEYYNSATATSWRNTSIEYRYMSDYYWDEFPIEETHRLLGEII
ncbi:ECs1072 family phage-associated protein, partial [Proteus terrae]